MKDAFDLWWQWAEKPLDSMLMIDADNGPARIKLRMALPWYFLEDPLDDAGADTEFPAYLEDAVTLGPQFNYLSFN